MVQPDTAAPGTPSPDRQGRRWPVVVAAVVILLVVAAFVANSISLNEYAFSPGLAQPVGPLIMVPPGRSHTPTGQILLTDIYLTQVRALQLPFYLLNPDDQVYSGSQVFGRADQPAQIQQQEALDMVVSSELARVVALRSLGLQVPERTGAVVLRVARGSPASRLKDLRAGDAIVSIDGRPTPTAQAAAAILQADHPGQRVTLAVQHTDGVSGPEVLSLGRNPTKPSQGYAGVGIETGSYFVLPFRVDINSDGIGGPSAGLAFTLGIIDDLTNGRLTGGHRVAATGTIDLAGRVGAVGGVAQKTIAVRNAGATVFLVPPGNEKDALSKAGKGLRIVPVANLSQALAALRGLGGDVPTLAPARPSKS